MRNPPIFPIILLLLLATNLQAHNLRKVEGGIKGSVVNSLFQDKEGLMYVSTNAGLSSYDGESATLLEGFTGVTCINGTTTGTCLIESLYDFRLLDAKTDSVATFGMFNNVAFSTSDEQGTLFILQGNGSIYYKTASQTAFDNVIVAGLVAADVKAFLVHNRELLVVTQSGLMRNFEIRYNRGNLHLNEKPKTRIPDAHFCFRKDSTLFLLDEHDQLATLDLTTHRHAFVADLAPTLSDKGKITAAILFRDEFYFGTESGLFVVRESGARRISIEKGITCLLKDRYQDFFWIGTSGGGLYTYSYAPNTISSHPFAHFLPRVTKPVTAVTANGADLWLGTAGNGIVVIPNYDQGSEITTATQLTTQQGLPDNTVHALHRVGDGIWIGCETGLAFYSFRNKTIRALHDELFRNIRAIYQQGETLYLACYSQGIVRVTLSVTPPHSILHTSLLSINNSDEAANRFTAICSEGKELHFMNEGRGIFGLTQDRLVERIANDDRIRFAHRIQLIGKDSYIATSDFGIATFQARQQTIQQARFVSPLASKEILPGRAGEYWISTTDGLILYHAELNRFRYFDNSYGTAVTEYHCGASFKDKSRGLICFGGINGFSTIKQNDYDEAMDYMPTLFAARLSLFGTERRLDSFMHKNRLILKADENLFSVTFNALDYIYGKNYTYYYKVGHHGQWIDNGNSGTISFTDRSPGSFRLFVKYYNKILNKESYTVELPITILPPWYQSVPARVAYVVLVVLLLGVLYALYTKRRRKRLDEERKQIEQQRKEELYEAKLDFFTYMSHEFCTPLTLISGPCNLIREQKGISPVVTKYAELIHRNAKRMNTLITDLMAFKQMESGYKQPDIEQLHISEVANRIADSFQINTSGEPIVVKRGYENGLYWNTDDHFFTTILTNLLSNAVKYASDGEIRLDITSDGQELNITVHNRGTGLTEAEAIQVFNKYTVLNSPHPKGWKQNGLGLVITASMVKRLGGSIRVDSVAGQSTSFVVTLPLLEAKEEAVPTKQPSKPMPKPETIADSYLPTPTNYEYKEERPTIAVIDDNPEMLWYICDVLAYEFNVIPINHPKETLETLHAHNVDLVLCDLMMNELNGIQLAERVKSDKETLHIPFIILSASHEIAVQTEAINAGAELFITKPFDNAYLKSAIKRLLGHKKDLRDYFASPLSAYELSMGKLQHVEHRKFLKKIYGIINRNIENSELSPDYIASELGMSTRSLYRKLSEATDRGLLEIIRDGKLSVAEGLLLKSKLTVDEIVHRSGFSNRASFYRAFTHKHGCTPTAFAKRSRPKQL